VLGREFVSYDEKRMQQGCWNVSSRAMFSHCLSDVHLIPPCDRLVLETEFAELCKWAVNRLRSCLLEIEQLCGRDGQQVEDGPIRKVSLSVSRPAFLLQLDIDRGV